MEQLSKLIQKQFDKMCATGKLFRSNIEGELLWEAYIQGFENDPIFRSTESSVHNCNYCKSFIKRYGPIVAVDENLNLMTIFDIEVPDEYKKSFADMSSLIKSVGKIRDIFVETFDFLYKQPYEYKIKRDQPRFKVGVELNLKIYDREDVQRWPNSGFKIGDQHTFHHLFLSIPKDYVDMTGRSIGDIISGPRSLKEVFKRGMDEIPLDTLYLVRDLEAEGALLNGASYMNHVRGAIKYAEQYKNVPENKKDTWCWLKSLEWGPACAFRNTAIGTLLVNLAEGKEINEACREFNRMMDPTNYMKATAPITQRQIQEAEKFVEENGYQDSFNRRCATLDDIKVCDILHSNQDAAQVKTKISVFDSIKPTSSTRHKRSEFKDVPEVTIEKFMNEILPGCNKVELFLNGLHKNNFVTLLTSDNKESKGIFKWDNNFNWTYNGNLAGKSQIKQAVKAAGGFVDAPFRFSIMWNEDGRSIVDFDAHAQEPYNGSHIYYGNFKGHKTSRSGMLDIDMINPSGVGVENIFWTDMKKVVDGPYKFWINNFNGNRNTGCKAEIAIGSEVYQYVIPTELKGNVDIATVYIKNGRVDRIDHSKYLVGDIENSENIYGLDTCKFHEVSLICLSPNFWQEHGVGNKHYFFMLKGAAAPEDIRSIHNEQLNGDLVKHRKVMEVLGAKLKCESTKGQLSGLGFNATVRDEVILKLEGTHKRMIKVKF